MAATPRDRQMISTQPSTAADGRRTYRRIVAKLGTNILTAGSDRLDL